MKKAVFALATSVLLSLFWPGVWGIETQPFAVVWFFALVPLLWVEEQIRLDNRRRKGWRFFGYAYLSMGAFNLGTTYWVWNAHWSGVAGTVFINGALMALVWSAFSWVARVHSPRIGYWTLVSGWLALEVMHEDWAFSFPWLDLGHIYAASPGSVQWYEYTGHRGGTLWLIVSSIVTFEALAAIRTHKYRWKDWKFIFKTPLPYVWFVPVFWSIAITFGSEWDSDRQVRATFIQPNLDPYKEKFETSDKNLAHIWKDSLVEDVNERLERQHVTKEEASTSLVVFPETFLHEGIHEQFANAFRPILVLDSFATAFRHSSLIVGANTVDFKRKEETSSGSNKRRTIEKFNSAIALSHGQPMEFYHKSKLVVGAEYMPFGDLLTPWLGEITLDLGGTTGALGTQTEREVFTLADTTLKVAPIICWEQDYGAFVREYAKRGANLFAIMTNDGWWGNSLGHVTHFHYARLRAIENRRAVVRAANTGISGFIAPNGQSYNLRTWDVAAMATDWVAIRNQKTFYTVYGDLIGRGGALLFPLLLLSVLVRQRVQR